MKLDIPELSKEPTEATETAVGELLLATIAWATANSIDPEGALREVSRGLIAQIRDLESTVE